MVGALLGASVASDIYNTAPRSRRSQYRETRSIEQRCDVNYVYRDEERVNGYNVEYEYAGDIYRTHLDYDPGDRLDVKVSVSPQRIY